MCSIYEYHYQFVLKIDATQTFTAGHVTDVPINVLIHYSLVVSSVGDDSGFACSLEIDKRAGQAKRELNRCHNNNWGRSSEVVACE